MKMEKNPEYKISEKEDEKQLQQWCV